MKRSEQIRLNNTFMRLLVVSAGITYDDIAHHCDSYILTTDNERIQSYLVNVRKVTKAQYDTVKNELLAAYDHKCFVGDYDAAVRDNLNFVHIRITIK